MLPGVLNKMILGLHWAYFLPVHCIVSLLVYGTLAFLEVNYMWKNMYCSWAQDPLIQLSFFGTSIWMSQNIKIKIYS
jgi:hypothetical protein